MAALRRRYARLGKTIRCDRGEYRISQIHPGVRVVHDVASGPSIFLLAQENVFPSVLYSVTRVAITKNEHGNNTFNTSEFLGALFSSALQNTYYPRHDRSLGDTMNRFSGALSSDAIEDLLREFTPDMKRLFHKHAPKKILRIEEKLPIPDEDKP